MRKFIYYSSCLLITVGCSHRISKKIGTLPPVASKSVDIQQIDEFTYLRGKAKLVMRENEKQNEVKAHVRIRKDSAIWMKLTFIGIQGGSALINKDSITVVSDLKKEYYVFTYEELSKRFNFKINFKIVQAALLGNLIVAKKSSDQSSEDSFFDKLTQKEDSVTIQNLVNKNTRKIERVDLMERNTGNSVKINYSEFQPLGDKLFPYRGLIDVFYKAQKGMVNTTILFEYSKMEKSNKENFPFRIPKRYERR